ncbi:MAG TPA: hypothetical protein VFS89_10235 [Nitrosospira sp.]|nr:hypothetical protein [Nitrosospira sp.]
MNGSSLYFRVKSWEKRDIACYTSTSSNTCTKLFKAAFLKRVQWHRFRSLLPAALPLPKRLPEDKGKRKHQEKIQGKMKNTPLLFVMITASFASFPSICENRNNNGKN